MINPVNPYLAAGHTNLAGSMPVKSQISFGGLSKNLVDKVDIASVFERLKGVDGVSHKSFEQIAFYAKEVAQKGNAKPEILVEIMVRFVSGVDKLCKNGVSFSESCHKMARTLYKEFGVNQHKNGAFTKRWDKLLAMSSKEKNFSMLNYYVPDLEPTKKPIAFSYDDVRDMFEFLRKNWNCGDAAYRNVMHGRGLKGWLSYLSEEMFPTYYDDFYRKH